MEEKDESYEKNEGISSEKSESTEESTPKIEDVKVDNIESLIEEKDLIALNTKVSLLKDEVAKMLIGQDHLIDLLLVSLFTGGHVLLEGIPGIAKTMAAKLLAKTINTDFSRIQFTPDLMPADVIGTTIFNRSNSTFEFQKGPVFSNLVLIDEINRAPAKTQAALIEVMEE